ncbi:phosphatase PAP2 family protein [Paenibacillus ginsengarvi]|uniref:Phosphatase PAP2 family protein n=2 Tax=Paenibacillus ginsengarvi TaxID=400777 RepID=A0A3B0AVL7_9BACL|nr:phosphatase PAP2 family protein [Paenibacillus ginsengarvi]
MFGWLTHLGGALFTISFVLATVLFASEPWRSVGWKSLVSLAVSHAAVAIIKRKVDRTRPYMALSEVITGPKPLKDPSFPSGHTTAVFSIFVPFALASVWLSLLVIPMAATVGMSRMYLGLHYPSDCLAGCLIGTGVSIVAAAVL